MKKLICIVALFVFISNLNSQSWVSSNGLFSDNDVNTISSTIASDASVVVLGFFVDNIYPQSGEVINSYGSRDYFVAKFNPQGDLDWLHNLGSAFPDFVAGGIYCDVNDDVFVTGSFMGDLFYSESDSIAGTGSFDIFFIKFNLGGDILFAKNIGKGANMQISSGLSVSVTGDILIAGQFKDSIEIEDGVTLYATNSATNSFYGAFDPSTGSVKWLKQIDALSSTSSCTIAGFESGTDWLAFTGMFTDSIEIDNDTVVSVNHSQDVVIFKTDLSGNLIWHRRIGGELLEYCYNLKANNENELNFGVYYNSPSILIDAGSSQTDTVDYNFGSYDIIIGQYAENGDLNWKKTVGGKAADKVNRSDIFEDIFYLSGSFSDTLYWGGILLKTKGPSDQDMFTGSIDKDGNFRSANSYGGDVDANNNSSKEEGRSIFQNSTTLYSILRSNSKILRLGDDIYSTSGNNFSVSGNYWLQPNFHRQYNLHKRRNLFWG